MFLHLSVILFGEGCVSQHALGQTQPWAPPGQTPHYPRADTPPGQTPPGQAPPQQKTTAADGTHPTGMHSCLEIYLQYIRCLTFTLTDFRYI